MTPRSTPALAFIALLVLPACGQEAPAITPEDAVSVTDVDDAEPLDVDEEAEVTTPIVDVGPPDALDSEAPVAPEADSDDALDDATPDSAEGDDAAAEADADAAAGPFVCTDDQSCDGRVEVALCQRATCVAGHCAALPEATLEGETCDDGNACTTGNVCQNGLCTTGVPVDCSALAEPPCTLGVCDVTQGGCVVVLAEEGLACDDGDLCTEADLCAGGSCEGQSLCDDGDVCNGYEGCEPDTGACSAGAPLACDGTDPCLGTSFCDAIFGCVVGAPPDCGDFVCGASGCPSSCDDHAQCVAGTYCEDGICTATLVEGSSCSDSSMCSGGYCDGALCCSGGQCCTADAQCPLKAVDVLVSQESYDAASGFSRVVITQATGGLQTLVATGSGVLERVDFMLQTTADEGYLVKVTIWSGVPPEAVELGSTTLLVLAPTSEPTIWTATLGNPIAVDVDETLSIGLSWLNGDADCQLGCSVIWMGAEGDPYPEGVVHRTFDSGASWHASDFNDDLWFRLWAGQHSCENFTCGGAP